MFVKSKDGWFLLFFTANQLKLYLLNKVLEMQTRYGSILKNDNDVYEGNDYHTFFYYMKKKVPMDSINSLEFSLNNNSPIEWDIKDFLLTRDRHIEIDRLGLLARQVPVQKIFFIADSKILL